MKNIGNKEIYTSLTRASQQLEEIYSDLHKFQLRATLDDTAEGCMFAATMRRIQATLADAKNEMHFTACCYSGNPQ